MSRVKGSQLIGVVKALRSQRERAMSLLPQPLRRYLDQRILAASWYSESDFRDLTLALGRLVAPTVKGNVWRMIGAMGAQRDFATTYAAVIRIGDPTGTLRRFPDAWRLYRDSAKMVVEEHAPGFARVALYEYTANCRELAELNAAYLEGALKAAGAEAVRVSVVQCEGLSARWELSWQESGVS